ncbi:phosphotransferase [Candidatus Poribacteria bacterium]|nr:phosphotransferase [Candidatus Poribacteria bacterium]
MTIMRVLGTPMYDSGKFARDLNLRRGIIPFFLDIPQQGSVLLMNPMSWECALMLTRSSRNVVVTHPSKQRLSSLAQMHQKYKDFEYPNSCSIQFVQCTMGNCLPFRDNSFDITLCHLGIGLLDCISSRWQLSQLHRIFDEIHRVMSAAGQLFLIISNEWIPSGLVDYRKRSRLARWSSKAIPIVLHVASGQKSEDCIMHPVGWRQILHGIGFHYLETYRLVPEYMTLAEIVWDSDFHQMERRNHVPVTSQNAFIRDFGIAAFKTKRQSFWEQLRSHITQQLGITGRSIQSHSRILVRRAGKMNFVLASADEDIRMIVKVPWTKRGEAQETKNFDALTSIQMNPILPLELRKMIPTPIMSGVYQGQPYFVEKFLDGVPLSQSYKNRRLTPQILSEALTFAITFYENTAVLTKIESDWLDQTLDEFSRFALNATYQQDMKEGLIKLVEYLQFHLADRDIRLGWSHGDFSFGNCMSVDENSLSGVIDWESFTRNGFPLADAIHFMNTIRDQHDLPSWQVLQHLAHSSLHLILNMMQSYMKHFDIPYEIMPSIILMVWVNYVIPRLNAGQFRPKWMHEQFYLPMQFILQFLSKA